MSALSKASSGSNRGACPLIEQVASGPSDGGSGAKPRVRIDLKLRRLKNLKHTVRTTARLICETITGQDYRCIFLTLTYRDDVEWSPRHISRWAKSVREWLHRRDSPALYIWVAELTKKGKVHYHAVLWIPKHLYLPRSDTCGWWPHGMTKTETARRPVGYLMKYVSKGTEEMRFKKGLRLVGTGGLSALNRLERAWWKLPRWLREETTPKDRVIKAKGGGWVSRLTGRIWPGVWRFLGVGPPVGDDRYRYVELERLEVQFA
jgi:hypothetical protein